MKFCTKMLISCVCLLILLFAVPSQAQLNIPEERLDDFQTACKVFSQTDLVITDIKLQAWGQISNKPEPIAKLKEKYETLVRGIKLDIENSSVQVEKDGFAGISQIETKEDGIWQLSLQAIPISGRQNEGKIYNEGESYLGFLYTTKNPSYAGDVYDVLVSLLKGIGFKNQLGVTFRAKIPGYLDLVEQNNIIELLAASVKGEFVEGVVQGNYNSKCYYTRENKSFLNINGKKINLNIALSYDEMNNTTNIYVASPLIYQDY